jgi:hypothetical protein
MKIFDPKDEWSAGKQKLRRCSATCENAQLISKLPHATSNSRLDGAQRKSGSAGNFVPGEPVKEFRGV